MLLERGAQWCYHPWTRSGALIAAIAGLIAFSLFLALLTYLVWLRPDVYLMLPRTSRVSLWIERILYPAGLVFVLIVLRQLLR